MRRFSLIITQYKNIRHLIPDISLKGFPPSSDEVIRQFFFEREGLIVLPRIDGVSNSRTDSKISTLFHFFTDKVVLNKSRHTPNELVGFFVDLMAGAGGEGPSCREGFRLLGTKGVAAPYDKGALETLLKDISDNCSREERGSLVAASDRLIEDVSRRRNGEFFTPAVWADEAHRMLEVCLGKTWKEEYVVWDPACGTKNLTRDCSFKELYCSTLAASDVEVGKGLNKEALSFQYDFLNDDVSTLSPLSDASVIKIPLPLLNSLRENKPLLFLLNPPYATTSNMGTNEGAESKGSISFTGIRTLMQKDGLGRSSPQLYAQFLYRIAKIKQAFALTEVSVGIFSPSLWLTGSSFRKLREYFFSKFNFVDGMLFKAGHFSDVESNWGIAFTVWSSGEERRISFPLKIKDTNGAVDITEKGVKTVYSLRDEEKASLWVREKIRNLKTYDKPQLTNPVNVKDVSPGLARVTEDALGYFHNDGNSVYRNNQFIGLYSSACSSPAGLSVTRENFMDCVSLFTARRLVPGNWENYQDEYMKPLLDHPAYAQWNRDAVVYSLFNAKSNQSSLRGITYQGRTWDVRNEFFFMGNAEMQALASECNYEGLWQDAEKYKGERFVFNLLQSIELSRDANAVLNKARDLVRSSMCYREKLQEENASHHLNSWDAGWYQVRLILKRHDVAALIEFRALYGDFEKRLRPLVYELGFLRGLSSGDEDDR